jgi:hypothetical protein
MFRRKLAALASIGTIVLGANAALATSVLVDQGDNTYDPTTHLEWLDVSLTAGKSYDDVSGGYGAYTTTQGYKYATQDQLFKLFIDGGTFPGYAEFTTQSPPFTATQTLISLLGATIDVNNFVGVGQEIKGIIRASPDFGPLPPSGTSEYGDIFALINSTHGKYLEYASVGNSSFLLTDSYGDLSVGSFLVKSTLAPTPIPATLPLFVSALGGLGFLGYRRRAKHWSENMS